MAAIGDYDERPDRPLRRLVVRLWAAASAARRMAPEMARLRRSFLVRLFVKGSDIELLHRAMAFAALGLVTLAPLLIVVAAVNPFPTHSAFAGFGGWLVDAMGISGRSADAVQDLFSAPRQVLSTTGALSLVALAVFGLSFAGSVQTGFEKIWGLSVGPWHKAWRGTVWLAVLGAYLFAMAISRSLPLHGWPRSSVRAVLIVVGGMLFFWWSQHFLLAGRVHARLLAPGAIAVMAGMVGLRAFSTIVFAPLIVSNAVTYGAVGTILIVESWLIGAGFVVYGGALLGRHVQEHPREYPPGDAAAPGAGPDPTPTPADRPPPPDTGGP